MKKIHAILLSTVIMICTSLLLLAIFSVIITKTASLPKGMLPVLTTGAGCIAIFAGAFFSALYLKEKGILLGLLSGGIFLLICAAASFLIFRTELTPAAAGKGIALLISGALGGILGVNRKSKVKF